MERASYSSASTPGYPFAGAVLPMSAHSKPPIPSARGCRAQTRRSCGGGRFLVGHRPCFFRPRAPEHLLALMTRSASAPHRLLDAALDRGGDHDSRLRVDVPVVADGDRDAAARHKSLRPTAQIAPGDGDSASYRISARVFRFRRCRRNDVLILVKIILIVVA